MQKKIIGRCNIGSIFQNRKILKRDKYVSHNNLNILNADIIEHLKKSENDIENNNVISEEELFYEMGFSIDHL